MLMMIILWSKLDYLLLFGINFTCDHVVTKDSDLLESFYC